MAFWLQDKERSAFGLGWETRRRNGVVDDNTFEIGSPHWRDFRAGFNTFKEGKLACYDDPAITSYEAPPEPSPKRRRRN